jgi:hypothetical protein
MTTRRLCGVWGSFGLALLTACGVDSPTGNDEGYVIAQAASLELNRACNDSIDAVYARPSGPTTSSNAGGLGEIVRCSKGRKISADEVNQKLNSFSTPFKGTAAKYPVQLYRISYRTTRLNNSQPDLGTALVLLPAVVGRNSAQTSDTSAAEAAPVATKSGPSADPPPAPGDDGLDADSSVDEDAFDARNIGSMPLVLFAHGTAPWGNACAASKLDPVTAMDADEEMGVQLALAGRGFPVISPDYAGYVQGSLAPGYLLSPDEAHSILDATRAFPKLVRGAPNKVAFVGHSQGGHAVLSAQALANSYGMSGKLAGVAAFAPFWAPGRTLGLVINPLAGYTVEDTPEQIKFAIEYFYTHAEVYDGAGAGSKLFKPDPSVQNALSLLTNTCSLNAEPSSDFGSSPSDFLIPEFDAPVGNCGLERDLCNDEGGAATIWEARFQADRPQLNKSGAPIVLWQGKNDATIFPQLAKCGIDKIRADVGNKFMFCGDQVADHQTILSRRTHWVIRWIKARTLGHPEPNACNGEEAISEPGMTLECLTPPGNDD